MKYMTGIISLNIMDIFTSNTYMLDLMFVLLLVGSAFVNGKKNLYYNKGNKDPKMQKHGLNTIYHLNEKKRLDYDEINQTIAKYNIFAALIAGASIAIAALCGLNDTWSFAIGLAVLIGATYLLVVNVCYKGIAKKYEKSK